MTARVKLAEASFFLEKLEAADTLTMDFRYYASACASALYGALQHLLYDYAMKNWKNIDEDDYLDSRLFRLLAKVTGDSGAVDFVEWYDALLKRIEKNDDARIAWNLRRMETHRVAAPYQYRLGLFEAVNMSAGTTISGHIEYAVVRPSGTVIPSGTSIPTRALVDEVPNSRVDAYFREKPSKPVRDVLGNTITFVDSLISEAELKFNLP
jgi:hypothetical protein